MEIMHLGLIVIMCVGIHASLLHRQKRTWIIESFELDEGHKGPFPYSLGPIKVEKNITIFEIHGQGFDEEPKGVLQINERTGELTVHSAVDYEQYKRFTVTFQAFRENKILDTQLGIEITIKDSNDNPPLFHPEKYEITIQESEEQGTEVTTVWAKDKDSTEKFKTFDLRIVSVTPKPSDLEFYLTQNADTGSISFKGCLDHEKAEKYTIIVEAKDHGEIPLSSSCSVIINIEDGNNHLPMITGQTGSKRVKEGEKDVLVSRLQVFDADTTGSSAWRAKYIIQGEPNRNFKIRTDPETNEGLLYVVEPLDYEKGSVRNLTVTVDNDIPYYSCKVLHHSTTGLWNVQTVDGSSVLTHESSTIVVTVNVEDVNEPPIFEEDYKKVIVVENAAAGKHLETFTAIDYDFMSENKVVYKKGNDPADWVVVDPVTGRITTKTIIDRESSFVNRSIYEVTIYAVDNGQPPMSATATLQLYIKDQNDNAPSLANTTIQICQSDGPSLSNITAFDPDENPYAGPFLFKLLGDVKGKWSVKPEKGYSVNLVKEPIVHSGHHELMMEVADSQGESSVHSISVTVCKCLDMSRPNCYIRRSTGFKPGSQALGIILFTLLMFGGILLLVFLMSCKRQKLPIKYGESEQHLMKSNMEHKGNDCIVVLPNAGFSKNSHQIITSTKTAFGESQGYTAAQRKTILEERSTREDFTQWSLDVKRKQGMNGTLGSLGQRRTGYEDRHSVKTWEHHINSAHYDVLLQETLLSALAKGLHKLQAPGEELGHYDPHVYTEEGVMESNYQLDAISFPDIPFDPDSYRGLDVQFSTLTSICFPNASSKHDTQRNPVKTQSSEVSRVTS